MHLKLKTRSASFHHNSGAACKYHSRNSARQSPSLCFPDLDLDDSLDFHFGADFDSDADFELTLTVSTLALPHNRPPLAINTDGHDTHPLCG